MLPVRSPSYTAASATSVLPVPVGADISTPPSQSPHASSASSCTG